MSGDHEAEDGGHQWVDYQAAGRVVQHAHGPLCGPEDARRWLFDRAIAGTIRAHSGNAERLANIVQLHREGSPDMHNNLSLFKVRWALADVNAALAAEAAANQGLAKRGRGRPAKWPWDRIMAETVRKFPEAGSWSIDAIVAQLCIVAQELTSDTPVNRTARPYAAKIQEAWRARRGK